MSGGMWVKTELTNYSFVSLRPVIDGLILLGKSSNESLLSGSYLRDENELDEEVHSLRHGGLQMKMLLSSTQLDCR